MSYKEALTQAMTDFARDPLACFVGYGLRRNGALGTLKGVKPSQIVEMPVAENLLVGAAIGLALAGRRPLVYIERADFLMHAMDAIVNHLDKIATLSSGEFRPAVILRITVGNSTKPLFTGPVHTRDFSEALSKMVSFRVFTIGPMEHVPTIYAEAYRRQLAGQSTALFEYKDLL